VSNTCSYCFPTFVGWLVRRGMPVGLCFVYLNTCSAYLPAGWGTLPPPPINFCSPGFDYTVNVLLRGVIADLMEVNGRLAVFAGSAET
jgi:hypothetical protein